MKLRVAPQLSLISVYSATHFLVDFACAFLMFSRVAGTPEGYLCVLLYNFCAFALQMPFGIVADKVDRNFLVAVLGCLVVGAAYGLVALPLAAVVVIGIGNAMFHIGGGIDVLNVSGKKLGALGVFVSPGAFGVYLGTMLGKGGGFPALLAPAALVVAAAAIFLAYRAQRGTYPRNAVFSFEETGGGSIASPGNAADSFHPRVATADSNNAEAPAYSSKAEAVARSNASSGARAVAAAIGCLFLVVCLRSFVGLSLDFPWKGAGYWGVALIIAVVLGKTLGGFAADRFGPGRTAAFSLGAAALLFLFPLVQPAGLAAVLLFNMTMPITLWAMARVFPGAKGLAFGLLSFGLFIGFLPVYLSVRIPPAMLGLFAAFAVVSLVLLLAGLRKAKLWQA